MLKRMELFKRILTHKKKAKTPTSTSKPVTAVRMSQFAQSNEDQFGFSDVSRVNVATAVNNVNINGSLDYFWNVVTGMLSLLDHISSDGIVCKCISITRHAAGIVQSSIRVATVTSTYIVPDSGATSHMQRNRSEFEVEYVAFNDLFVLIGNNSKVPVLGYSTS